MARPRLSPCWVGCILRDFVIEAVKSLVCGETDVDECTGDPEVVLPVYFSLVINFDVAIVAESLQS
jgi:hypothetical protein